MARRTTRPSTLVPNLLVGLGVALLVIAVLLPTYVAGKLITTPLDTGATTVATSTATVLDRASLQTPTARVDTDVPVSITRTVSVVDPVSAEVLTFQAAQIVERTDREGDAAIVDGSVDRVTVDRVTGSSDGQPTGSIDLADATDGLADRPADPVVHAGLSYKFPFDVQQQAYDFFDVTTRQAWPAEFDGNEELNGETVYRFVQRVPATDLFTVVADDGRNRLELPASQVGLDGTGTVELHRWYSNTRTLFVDPASGAIVNGQEQVRQYYAEDGEEVIVAFEVTAGFDDATIEAQQRTAADAASLISLVTRILPLTLGVVGVLLVVAGVVLHRRAARGSRPGAGAGDEPSGPVHDPASWVEGADTTRPSSDYDLGRR